MQTPEGVPGFWNEAARPPEYGRGFLYGLGAAVAGAVGWYAITYITGWELGLVAVLVGWGVGRAVFAGAGRRGDSTLQWMAAMLGGLGIIIGYYLVLRHNLRDVLWAVGEKDPSEWALTIVMVRLVIKEPSILVPWAVAFTGFGIYEAWKGARAQAPAEADH